MRVNKLLLRYLVYFGIFICFVQIIESAYLQELLAQIGLSINLEPLGTYAPLFLSVLLIDITYRQGELQNKIAEQQRKIQEYQYKLDKYKHYEGLYKDLKELQKRLSEFKRHVNSGMCHLYYNPGRNIIEHAISEMRTLRKRIDDNEASFSLKLPDDTFKYEDVLEVFINCERINDRVESYINTMNRIDHYSLDQIKRRYRHILEAISQENHEVDFDAIFNAQKPEEDILIDIKTEIQKHLFIIEERNINNGLDESVDMIIDVIDFLGFDKDTIIKWYADNDKLMDKIFIQSDIINRIKKECAIDINK